MSRLWPGFLAVWVAIGLHAGWVLLLLLSGSRAFDATPVHELYGLSGFSSLITAGLLAFVVLAALIGCVWETNPSRKIFYLLPQQLVLGVSAAGAFLAIIDGRYSDGVYRPWTFIAADQLAVVLTWLGHTAALMILYLIHTRHLTADGRVVVVGDHSD